MILLYILISIFLLIIILLLIPIQIKIDSPSGIYQIEWRHILKANLLMVNDEPIARMKVFFLKKDFELLKIKPQEKQISKKKKKKKYSNKNVKNIFRKKIKKILKTIQVKQFFLNIDTNDYVWNAYLYPIFYFIRKDNKALQINFQGDVELLLKIQARPIKVLFAFIF